MDVVFIMHVLLYTSMPGAAGGFALFLFGIKRGHYRNNKYIVKCTVEILGAAVTATFIGSFFPQSYRIGAGFLIGLTWVNIIQISRSKITKIVETALGEKLGD